MFKKIKTASHFLLSLLLTTNSTSWASQTQNIQYDPSQKDFVIKSTSSPSIDFIESFDPGGSLVGQAVVIDSELKKLKQSSPLNPEVSRLKTLQFLYSNLASNNCIHLKNDETNSPHPSKKDTWIQGISWGIALNGLYSSPFDFKFINSPGTNIESFSQDSSQIQSITSFQQHQSRKESYDSKARFLTHVTQRGLEQTHLSKWILEFQFTGKTPDCTKETFSQSCRAFIERSKNLTWLPLEKIVLELNTLLTDARIMAAKEIDPFITANKTIYKDFHKLDKSHTRLNDYEIELKVPHPIVAFPKHISILEKIAQIPGIHHLAQDKGFAKMLSRILEPKLKRECLVDTPQKEEIVNGKRVITKAKMMCWYQKSPAIFYTRDKDNLKVSDLNKALKNLNHMIAERQKHFEHILHDIHDLNTSLETFLTKDLSFLPETSSHPSRPSREQITSNQYRRREVIIKDHFMELLNQSPHLFGYALLDYPEYIPNLCSDLIHFEKIYKSQINSDNIKNSLLILGLIGLTFVESPIALAMVVGITGYEVYHYLHEAQHEEAKAKQVKTEVLAMNFGGYQLPEHKVDEMVDKIKELEAEALKFKIYSGLASIGFINAPVLGGHLLQTKIIGKFCSKAKSACNDIFLFNKNVDELNEIYRVINSHSKTRKLLASMSKKYNAEPEDIVILLNSKFASRATHKIDELEHQLEHASHFLAHDLHHLNKAPEYAHLAERAVTGTVKYLLPSIKYARFARSSRVILNSGLQLERSREFAELYAEVSRVKEFELKELEPGHIFTE